VDPFLHDLFRRAAFGFFAAVIYAKSIFFKFYLCDTRVTYNVGWFSSVFENPLEA